MANFDTSAIDFDNKIQMLEPTDANSNILFNLLFQKIVNNTEWLSTNKLGICDTSSAAFVLCGKDSRNVSSTPTDYMEDGSALHIEFKYASILSLNIASESKGYVLCFTCVPWGDSSGGRPLQIAVCSIGIYARPALSDTDWSSWKTIITF